MLQRVTEEQNVLQTTKRKTNWFCHILSRNCLLKYDIGEKIEGRITLREDEEEGLSSYWMTLRKTEDAGN